MLPTTPEEYITWRKNAKANPFQEADWFDDWIKTHDMSVAGFARSIGCEPAYVQYRLYALAGHPDLRHAFEAKFVKWDDVRTIAMGNPNHDIQREALSFVMSARKCGEVPDQEKLRQILRVDERPRSWKERRRSD